MALYSGDRLSLNSIVTGDNLDNFNEDFESLLETHEQDRKRNKFQKERLSIISSSKKKKAKKKKKEYDELDDIKEKLQTLQNILKYLPDDPISATAAKSKSKSKSKLNEKEKQKLQQQLDEEEVACSGFLVVVGGNISEATRFYAELVHNILYLKREPSSKIKQVITISFIQSNTFDDEKKENSEDYEAKQNWNNKYLDLFVAHLESRSANNSFKLFSPVGIYVISASCDRDKKRFCCCIESALLSIFSNETWIAKMEACKQLLPIEKSQFEIQIERHSQIMNSLTLTGLAHNVGLLGSTNKEKSGVMRILKHTHSHSHIHDSVKHHKWEDHFFVLAHQTLYYFQHDPDSQVTHSSMPKSFIPLKYATVQLDEERIKCDRFVFYVQTPLRTIYLRCRHPVALSEWFAALCLDKIEARHILDKIRGIRSKVSTLNSLLCEKKGIKIFDTYLKHRHLQSILRCWLAILHYKQQNHNVDNAQLIFEQYINDKGQNKKKCIWQCLGEEDYDCQLIGDIHKCLNEAGDGDQNQNENQNDKNAQIMKLFDGILSILDEKLSFEFKYNFVVTAEYKALREEYDSLDKYLPLPLNREVKDFEENSVLILTVTNTDLSSKEIKLSTKKSVATIGRDCSNQIVLDDAHVSRSHARVQYNEYDAYFTDLGSHHGSYLNGNRVLHERLADGDRLKLGGCDIVFTVKIKKNIIDKVFNKFLSNSSNQKRRETLTDVTLM